MAEMEFNNGVAHLQEKHQGLSSQKALELQVQYGKNALPTEKGISPWVILLNQFKSPLVYIILVAALVSLIVQEYGDFAIIMVVVVVDAIMGFVQEYNAQRTYFSLKNLIKPTTTVIRDGYRQELEVVDLVPGDIVVLSAGEHVPADGFLLESTKVCMDEAILTGESEPVTKNTNEENNKTFMGTTVLTGHGLMQVDSIGLQTELGKIAASVQEPTEEETPLQIRLKVFSTTLTKIVLALTVAILVVGLIMGNKFLEMLRTSIILAIAAVPEGLLIAVTMILVLGMRKILKRHGLVKRLSAVETLGSVTTICTDKTGTITEGRMRVTRTEFKNTEMSQTAMVLCNNLEGPVDIALWKYAESQIGSKAQELFNATQRFSEEVFASDTKFMSVDVALPDGKRLFLLKGAPEIVLGMCAVSQEEKIELLTKIDNWAGEGLRLLGLAVKAKNGSLEEHSGYEWLGLLGMEDPVREGVVNALQVANHAGIKVKMITGDYRRTAEKIARNIGLFQDGDEILEGSQIASMSDEELMAHVNKTAIFARIYPQDKLRIVRALRSNGEITAMIGDGVNDAPALKHANIGVVVGSATDVAKEISDVVLMDDNFSTIVAAIEEGRVIFENIRKVVAYTLSNSFAEVLTIFISMILKWPTPLLVAQILWIHLICDGPSDIVLGFEPKEPGIMNEKPKSVKEPILPRLSLILIGVISIGSAIAALLVFNYHVNIIGSIEQGRSIVFASFAINSMIYIFAYRSMRTPIYKMPPLSQNKPLIYAVVAGIILAVLPFLVPGLQTLLGIVPLTVKQWGFVALIAFTMLAAVEIGKAISLKTQKKNGQKEDLKA
ncbi:MAG: HAD-IC family P-type ATPase [Anaerolineaceae bacterium]